MGIDLLMLWFASRVKKCPIFSMIWPVLHVDKSQITDYALSVNFLIWFWRLNSYEYEYF